jgi:ABC-2 type transport system permease protein
VSDIHRECSPGRCDPLRRRGTVQSLRVLSWHDAGWPITHPGVLRAAVASALLVPICALAGMGIGALIRHTATTIVAVVVGLDLLLPTFLSQSQRHPWLADVHNALPLIAWQRLVFIGADHSPYDPSITGSWIVYALWPLIPAVLAVIVVHSRDV